MAKDETNACAHTLHFKILYFGLILLTAFSVTGFAVTYVSVAQLRTELGKKCSCPDGETLFNITVKPRKSHSARGPGHADRGGDRDPAMEQQHHRHRHHNKSQVRAELELTAPVEPETGDLRALNRVRRFALQNAESSTFMVTSIEACARLPITISVSESSLNFPRNGLPR